MNVCCNINLQFQRDDEVDKNMRRSVWYGLHIPENPAGALIHHTSVSDLTRALMIEWAHVPTDALQILAENLKSVEVIITARGTLLLHVDLDSNKRNLMLTAVNKLSMIFIYN